LAPSTGHFKQKLAGTRFAPRRNPRDRLRLATLLCCWWRQRNIRGNGNITIKGNNEISAATTTFTPSSANLIGVHNSAQFEKESSLVSIKANRKRTTTGTTDFANVLTSGTSISTNTITSSGLITVNTGITTGTTSSLITVNNGILVNTTTTGTNDILNMRYDTWNRIRFSQRYVGVDDVRYDLLQKVPNVDKTTSLTFYYGNFGIGKTDPTNIFQVETQRFRIVNDDTDVSII
jgi:hypothetical protein